MARQARTITTAPTEAPEILPAVAADIEQAQREHALAETAAASLATQLGYEGSLTLGALEDEIRFYAEQSVLSLLEVGKRLLLLRELTPRGEFDQRLEMLGFPRSSAYRFMQAARKTLKSPTVRLLAEQVKNRKAFLELVTHDDDADIEAVAQLDDIERMSASQLREALRDAKKERERLAAVNAEMQGELSEAKVRARTHVVTLRRWPEAFDKLEEQRHAAFGDIVKRLDVLDGVLGACNATPAPTDEEGVEGFATACERLAIQFCGDWEDVMKRMEQLARRFDQTLGALCDMSLADPLDALPDPVLPLPTDAERAAAVHE